MQLKNVTIDGEWVKLNDLLDAPFEEGKQYQITNNGSYSVNVAEVTEAPDYENSVGKYLHPNESGFYEKGVGILYVRTIDGQTELCIEEAS